MTETVKLPEAVLPAASIAEQLTVVVPGANVKPEAGEQVTVTALSTMSLADALNVTTTPASEVAGAVRLPGNDNVGLVVSCTVTVKLSLPVLPAASVAEQITGVVPSGKVDPEEGEQLGVTVPSTRSRADAVKVTTAPEGPVASAVMPAGIVIAGAVVSWTVTVKLSLVLLPRESLAEQLTVVITIGNVEPEIGEQVGATVPSTISVAEAL